MYNRELKAMNDCATSHYNNMHKQKTCFLLFILVLQNLYAFLLILMLKIVVFERKYVQFAIKFGILLAFHISQEAS